MIGQRVRGLFGIRGMGLQTIADGSCHPFHYVKISAFLACFSLIWQRRDLHHSRMLLCVLHWCLNWGGLRSSTQALGVLWMCAVQNLASLVHAVNPGLLTGEDNDEAAQT